MNADNFATAGRAKARHYQKLASEMRKMAENCDETRTLFERLQYDLQAMNTLVGLHAAQFMAFTSIEDRKAEQQQKGRSS